MPSPADVCGDCGEQYVWDADASSGVCPQCGTLQDPSQSILAAHLDSTVVEESQVRYDGYGHGYGHGHAAPFASSSSSSSSSTNAAGAYRLTTTLKSFRNSDRNWDLPGQGKAAYAERAKLSMHKYTAALASRLGHSGLAARAQLLFDQAMAKGNFRWGRKARLVAGASMAIALREAHKGETLRDVSYLIDESPVQLARALTIVLGLLEIKLPTLDPSWHFPTLQKHIIDVLNHKPCPLPSQLAHALKSLHLPSLLRTATSLSELVSRSCILSTASTPPTACAIYILAMEGELSASLPKCTELGREVGKRFGVSGDLVMKRYKVIYEEIEAWVVRVPWLGEVAGEGEGAGGKKKSVKLSKRTAVARVLKDVIQYEEGVWQGRLKAQPALEEDATEGEIEEADVSSRNLGSNARVDEQGYSGQDIRDAGTDRHTDTHAGLQQRPELGDEERVLARRDKKKRAKGGELGVVSQFLLSPLDERGRERAKRARRDGVMGVDADKLAHFLTSETASFARPATRLQILSSQRREDDIADEELFGEGELENMIRTNEEADVLRRALGWDQSQDDDNSEGGHTAQARRRDRERGGTSRVNMEALERLLAESECEAVTEEATYDDGEDVGESWEEWTNLYGMDEWIEKEMDDDGLMD